MALKNLFDMVKADRYTQDGREAIIKAQEAETEDKVYQIGEISQKTGLQKTANGWVKPKSGKQPGAASKHDTDPQTYIVKKNDELRKMYLNEKDPAKKEAMKKALKKQASMMEPEPFSSTESKPDESARIAASKEARAKKSQELEQKAAGDFAKYKDLPPAQRKDALGAASHEGISIGTTQRSMEGMGWDLIQADDKVNVYGKPDGSKAIMKHDGKKITEVSYEGPGSKSAAGSKPVDKEKLLDTLSFDLVDTTADIEEEYNAVEHSDNSRLPEFVRQEIERDYVNKTNGEKWSDAEKDIIAEEVTRRIKERQSKKAAESKPAVENKTVEKFDIEKWKTGPKVEKNSKLDWSHGVVGESIPVQGKSAEEKRNLINKYNSVGRLSRIGTKKNSYYNNKYGTFEVAGIDNDNVYIQEERSNGMGSRYMVLVTIPLNEVEEINPFHDYGKRNPETGEESPTRPPLPEDSAPRVLTGDCRIRIRKEKPALTGDTKIRVRK